MYVRTWCIPSQSLPLNVSVSSSQCPKEEGRKQGWHPLGWDMTHPNTSHYLSPSHKGRKDGVCCTETWSNLRLASCPSKPPTEKGRKESGKEGNKELVVEERKERRKDGRCLLGWNMTHTKISHLVLPQTLILCFYQPSHCVLIQLASVPFLPPSSISPTPTLSPLHLPTVLLTLMLPPHLIHGTVTRYSVNYWGRVLYSL